MGKTEMLLQLAEVVARKKSDGHLTIMRFTTGWETCLFTPNLDCSDGREEVRLLQKHNTLDDALYHLLQEVLQDSD